MKIRQFITWFWKVLTKWLTMVGILPFIVDIILSYALSDFLNRILPAYVYAIVENVLENGLTAQFSILFFALFLIISAYSVYIENEKEHRREHDKLAEKLILYEEHQPKYNIEQANAIVEQCGHGCHVELHIDIVIIPMNEWGGFLENIVVDIQQAISGLSRWNIDQIVWTERGGLVDFPSQLNPNRQALITLHIRAGIENEPLHEVEWQETIVPIKFVIGYLNQMGPVSYSQRVNAEIDLSTVFNGALEYQQRNA